MKNDLKKENQLIVYNRNGNVDIRIQTNDIFCSLDSLVANSINPVIALSGQKVLILNTYFDNNLETKVQYDVDYAIVVGDVNYSLNTIEERYNISKLVLDSSLKAHVRKQLTKECENRNILIHDVTKKGAFSLNF